MLLICAGFSTLSAQGKATDGFLFFKDSEIREIKSAVEGKDNRISENIARLRYYEKRLLGEKPWSVTFTPSPAASKNAHDYFSESSYWWPDPKNPDGPYIRKDGLRNPDRFDQHRIDIENMSNAVLWLSAYSYFFNDDESAAKARKLIEVWFLDDATKMNPHMKYAQAVRNKSEGRCYGILDSRMFVYVLEGVNFLRASGKWESVIDSKFRAWFREYLDWLTTSKNGIDEKTGGNNHSTWYAVQVAAVSAFLGDEENFKMIFDFTKSNLIENEIEADGSCPRELARTNSLSYSVFNLEAFSLLLRIGQLRGIDLWNFENSNQGSVAKAVGFVFPFDKVPDEWKREQITDFVSRANAYQLLAGIALNNKKYIEYFNEMAAEKLSGTRKDALMQLFYIYGKVYN